MAVSCAVPAESARNSPAAPPSGSWRLDTVASTLESYVRGADQRAAGVAASCTVMSAPTVTWIVVPLSRSPRVAFWPGVNRGTTEADGFAVGEAGSLVGVGFGTGVCTARLPLLGAQAAARATGPPARSSVSRIRAKDRRNPLANRPPQTSPTPAPRPQPDQIAGRNAPTRRQPSSAPHPSARSRNSPSAIDEP